MLDAPPRLSPASCLCPCVPCPVTEHTACLAHNHCSRVKGEHMLVSLWRRPRVVTARCASKQTTSESCWANERKDCPQQLFKCGSSLHCFCGSSQGFPPWLVGPSAPCPSFAGCVHPLWGFQLFLLVSDKHCGRVGVHDHLHCPDMGATSQVKLENFRLNSLKLNKVKIRLPSCTAHIAVSAQLPTCGGCLLNWAAQKRMVPSPQKVLLSGANLDGKGWFFGTWLFCVSGLSRSGCREEAFLAVLSLGSWFPFKDRCHIFVQWLHWQLPRLQFSSLLLRTLVLRCTFSFMFPF